MKNENILLTNSKNLAIQIIKLFDNSQYYNTLNSQILRSGTSIGANIREAQYAQSKADFINKFEIALKECYETEYWLELFYESKKINEMNFYELRNLAGSIRKLLITSIKSAKNSIKM